MAAASNYSPSKPAAGDSSAAIHSPHRRSPAPSPWTQVVRGPHEAEQIATSADLPDDLAQIQAEGGADGGAANSKKPAWNKPSNGAAEVGTVMGAELWPALSESARASPKSSSSDSPKPPLDGFVTLPQGTGIVHPSSHNQLMMNNAHPSLALPNHVIPTRQKSMKRGGGGGGGGSGSGSSSGHNIVNGGFSQQPPSPHIPPADVPPNVSAKSEPAVTELSPRDHAHKESGQRGVGSQSRSANEHIHRSDSFKKGNGGTHPRSDGSHHHNFGGRGNQDRGNHEWNSQRSFNGRDSHLQSQRASPRGFRPPNHSPTPFIHPSPVAIRPYPMVYPDVPPQVFFYAPSPESLRGVPFVGPISPHGMIYAGPDPQLIARIVHQIDYYFSNENLVKDTYLRNNMDDQGWVPVQLIASFKKMSMLTENIQLILDAVRTSNVLEVQGDKIRRREDWSRWIMPTAQSPNVSSPQAQGRSNHEMLIAKAQSLSLEENPIYHSQIEASFSRSSSGDFSQSQAPGQATVGGGSERTVSVRNPSE